MTPEIALLSLVLAAPPGDAQGGDGHGPQAGQAQAPAQGPAPGLAKGLRTVVEDETDPQGALDTNHPGFARSLDAQGGHRDLPEQLDRLPGVSVRSLGGLGQFSSISIRGSTAQQVRIFVDGVPLDSGFAGVVDVASLPMRSFDSVVVYRGFVPIRYGGSAIGGVLDLRTDLDAPTIVQSGGGLGSYGARRADAGVRLRLPTRRGVHTVLARANYQGATGNFPYLDTNSTPEDESDDSFRIRRNNAADRFGGHAAWAYRRGPWSISVRELGRVSRQEVPGIAAAPATQSALTTLASTTIARLGYTSSRLSVGWSAALSASRRRFDDPQGEVGVGVDAQTTDGLDVFFAPDMAVALWPGGTLTASADLRSSWASVDEANGDASVSGDADRRRLWAGVGLGLRQRLARGRILLVPAVRFDAVDSRFAVPDGEGEVDDQGRDTQSLAASPRVAARAFLVPGLSLRGSVGRYFRPPTLLELFGDRGYAVGNEGLRPEAGTHGDLGLIYARQWRAHDVRAEATGFVVASENLIQWVAAGSVVRPQNIGRALVAGSEASAQARLWSDTLVVEASYTYIFSQNRGDAVAERGQPLPGRPAHQLETHLELGRTWDRRVGTVRPFVFYEFDLIASSFLDPSGRLALPPRPLHGAGAGLRLGPTSLVVDLRNVGNLIETRWQPPVEGVPSVRVPVSDYIGYPLPGFSAFVSLRIELEPRK